MGASLKDIKGAQEKVVQDAVKVIKQGRAALDKGDNTGAEQLFRNATALMRAGNLNPDDKIRVMDMVLDGRSQETKNKGQLLKKGSNADITTRRDLRIKQENRNNQ
jgi:hypothetical protein